MSWNTFIKQFVSYLKLERSLSENSILAYERDIQKLFSYLLMVGGKENIPPPQKVAPQEIRDFLGYIYELKMSPYSQARILSGIKAFYKYLLIEEVVKTDPTELIESPKLGKKLPDTLSYEEIEALLNTIDLSTPEGARNRAIIELLYSSGLRVSELINLKRTDVLEEIGFLRILGKGNKERLVPIGSDALKYMNIYFKEIRVHVTIKEGEENIVFLNRRGKRLTRVMIFTIVKTLAKEMGLSKNISPHTFRHSFATHLIEGGADLRAVQEMLGHESITTTEIYTHIDRDFLRQTITEYHPRS